MPGDNFKVNQKHEHQHQWPELENPIHYICRIILRFSKPNLVPTPTTGNLHHSTFTTYKTFA